MVKDQIIEQLRHILVYCIQTREDADKDEEAIMTAIASIKAWDKFIRYMNICSEEAKSREWGDGCAFAKCIAEELAEDINNMKFNF